MRPIRTYNHGGWHPFKKTEGKPTITKMSEREEGVYGTVPQQLGDAVSQTGGRTKDLLKMLALTKSENYVKNWSDLDYSEKKPSNFKASRDENGTVKFHTLDEETQKHVVAKMNDGQLAEMFGRELKPSEEKYIRTQVFKNPALLSYFMGMGEQPARRDIKKFKVAKNVGKRSQNIGKGTTGGGSTSKSNGNKDKCVGDDCKKVIKGLSHSAQS